MKTCVEALSRYPVAWQTLIEPALYIGIVQFVPQSLILLKRRLSFTLTAIDYMEDKNNYVIVQRAMAFLDKLIKEG